MTKEKQKPGPEADRLKLGGDWKERLAEAVKKPRPKGGWPKPKASSKKRSEPQKGK